MQWNLEKFNIVNYNSKSIEHYQFINKLIDDPVISMYFKNEIKKSIENAQISQELIFNQPYLVKDASTLIGYLYLGNCDINGVLSMAYALCSEFRGKQIGTLMLKQIRNYLIQNLSQVNNIDLAIDMNNIAGIRTAIAADFEFYRTINHTKHYRYYI